MNLTRADILGMLPAFGNDRRVLVHDQDTNDIIKGILQTHVLHRADYDRISEEFLGKSVRATARNIWNFLKANIPYYVEDVEAQTLRSPSAVVAMPGDCKSYALFANGILDSLNRKGLLHVPIAYRFASYTFSDPEPKHVFSVIYPGTDREIWIDPVLSSFDLHKEPSFFKDKILKPMALIALSGVDTRPQLSRDEKIRLLKRFRESLDNERRVKLRSGNMKILSPADQQYTRAAAQLDKQIRNGGIGVIDPVTISSIITFGAGLLKKKANPAGSQWLDWDSLSSKRGDPFGSGAVAPLFLGPPEYQFYPSDVAGWIQHHGIDKAIPAMLANKKYGTVTLPMIIAYLNAGGYTDLTKQIAAKFGGSSTSTAVVPSQGGSQNNQVVSSGGGSNTILYVALGAGALYMLTRKSKKR